MTRILFDTNDTAYTITLNDAPLNILDIAMLEELRDALSKVGNDRHVLIVRAAGEKAFSAGASVQDHLGDRVKSMLGAFHDCFRTLNRVEIATIALVKGVALGGGCELALACDFRVAARRAKIGQTEINLGLTTGAGGIPRLVKLLGVARAKELVLLGERLSADEAHTVGLVTQVVENEEFPKRVAEFAGKLAASAPIAYRIAKALLNRAADVPIDAALEAEAAAFGLVTSSEDIFEGIQAMMEKRPPKFKGQ